MGRCLLSPDIMRLLAAQIVSRGNRGWHALAPAAVSMLPGHFLRLPSNSVHFRSEMHDYQDMHYRDKTVSREFRDALADLLPGLGDNFAYWRMTNHLLFSTFRDADTDNVLLPRQFVADMEGTVADANYSAIKFINIYRRDVMDFTVANHVISYDPDKCKYRSVASLVLPEILSELVSRERREHSGDRVWMSTGHVYLRKHIAEQRKMDRAEAGLLSVERAPCQLASTLLAYMNNLPPNRYTSILRHLPEAVKAAHGLADTEHQLNILAAVRDAPQPFYAPAVVSTRVFSVRVSILSLRRELRKIMAQDWINADLRSAQLGIVAKVWDVPSLTDYLCDGNSIWHDLCRHMDMVMNADNKATMKACLYAIVFGAGRKKMVSLMSAQFKSGAAAYERFRSHPILKALLIARYRQLRSIRSAGGGTDAFGRFIPIEARYKTGYVYEWNNSRSILACIAQSYELLLLEPVILSAISEQGNEHGFTITTWLHDGFTFAPNHSRADDVDGWKRRLRAMVENQATCLGIYTTLEFD